MADGVTIQLNGGKMLDYILRKLEPKKSSRIINAAMKKAGLIAEDVIKEVTPVSDKDSVGNKTYKSRNHKAGALRRSIKYGLRTRARPNENTFLAAIATSKGKTPDDDGWFGAIVKSGHGNVAPNDFMKKGTEKARSKFNSELENQLMDKLVGAYRKMLK